MPTAHHRKDCPGRCGRRIVHAMVACGPCVMELPEQIREACLVPPTHHHGRTLRRDRRDTVSIESRDSAKALLHEALHSLSPRIAGMEKGECHCNLLAEVALDALNFAPTGPEPEERGDFYVEDEPVADVIRAFEAGEKGVTARAAAGRTESLVIPLYGGDVMGTLREAIYGYAARLDAEADRVRAIPKTRQHGTTYNANVAVGVAAAARFLREWADEDAPWPDDDLAAQVSALRADVARLEGERDEAQAHNDTTCVAALAHRDLSDLLIETEAERDAMRAAVEAVLALHGPRPGWEREWKDPAEALRKGWPPCAGCDLVGVGYREIGNCPTRKALAAVDQTGARTDEAGPAEIGVMSAAMLELIAKATGGTQAVELVAEFDDDADQDVMAIQSWDAAERNQDAPVASYAPPQSDVNGSGVAQDVRDVAEAEKGAQGATEAAYEAGVAEGRRQAERELILATDMHQVGFLDADGRYWPGVDLHAPDGWEPVYAERKKADHA